MLINQRQPEHARQRWWPSTGTDTADRFAQPREGVGHGIEHAIGEMAGEGVQLSTLGHQLGLLLRIACAVGVVQQGLLQRLDGQDQGRRQRLPAQADQRAQQLTYPRWQIAGGQAVLVGRSDGKDS